MDVPQSLFARQQWILWKYIGQDRRKVPFQVNGEPAKSNDPATWSDYPEASAVLAKDGRYDGLGFVFADGGDLFGCDLDGCRNPETGEIAPWAMDILGRLSTYCEVSPSRAGVKFYGKGKVPSGTGKKITLDAPTCSSKLPGIELYDHGRYFCFTGQHLEGTPREVKECQPALDELFAKYWPSAPKPVYVPPARTNTAERAWKYISLIPPAVAGSGGHNATYHVACILVCGFALSEDEAFGLLSQWNATCLPPWSERELRHKIASAAKSGGPRGELLNSDTSSGPPVDLSGLFSGPPPAVPEPTHKPTPRKQEVDSSMDPGLLNPGGLIGDIIAHNLETAMYPLPELACAAAISLMATITGRKLTDSYDTRTNCYLLGLAPSGTGKDHARLINKRILIRVGQEKMVGPERVGSAAGMVTAIAESPAILFQLDEIAHLLQTMKNPGKSPHLYNIGTVLMQLYNSSGDLWVGDAYADSKKTKRINKPSACVYGTAPPDAFWASLTTENVADGLLGRMMVFESDGKSEMKPPAPAEVPKSIIDRVRMWTDFVPGAGNLASQNPDAVKAIHTLSARRRMEVHWREIHEKGEGDDPVSAPLWRRSGGKAGKLALVFAASRASDPNKVEVDDEDVHLAIKLSNWMTRRMILQVKGHVSENDREGQYKRVLRIIAESTRKDGRMSSSELTRKTQFLNRFQRKDLMEDLVHSGDIKQEVETSESNRSVTYFTFNFEALN